MSNREGDQMKTSLWIPEDRWEQLLNCFGQTIADLPNNKSEWDYTYNHDERANADIEATFWEECVLNKPDHKDDYICHLRDIILRMVVTLEKAKIWLGCAKCERSDNCKGHPEWDRKSCNFRLKHELLCRPGSEADGMWEIMSDTTVSEDN